VFGASTGASYSVLLVAANGSIMASAKPRHPSSVTFSYKNCPQMFSSPAPTCKIAYLPRAPLVTSSNTRAYYLDGDSDVGYLTPDGRTGAAVHLPANPRVRYGVAVSPDDSRIAVAAFEYLGSGTPYEPGVKLTIFVQDLAGGHRVDLFSSTSVSEWPIGWNKGHLVIAVGPGAYVQNTALNPYFAFDGYHVADATSGRRLVAIGGDCVYGPVVRAGAACVFNERTQNVLGYRSWDAIRHSLESGSGFGEVALSPDGSKLVRSAWRAGGKSNWRLALTSGSGSHELDVTGIVQGWLDGEHVVYYTVEASKTFILDLVTGVSAPVPQVTPKPLPGEPPAYLQFLGTVPQQMS
jgi:hypothetical protein